MDRDARYLAGDLLSGLERFSATSLREGAAVLALWPPNADRHAAMEALVDALAEAPETDGTRTIEARDWERWLACEDSAALRAVLPAGLHDAPLSEQAALFDERRTLVAGHLEFPALQYRLWSEALAAEPDPAFDRALDLLDLVSACSDQILEAAEIGGSRWPDHESEGAIGVPAQTDYERLRTSLRLEDVAGDPDLAAMLAPLIGSASTRRAWQPFALGADGVPFLSDPWLLGVAGLVRAAAAAAESGRPPEDLAGRLGEGALGVALGAARDMDWTIEQLGRDSFIARADLDCRILVAVAVVVPGADRLGLRSLEAPAAFAGRYRSLAVQARESGVRHSLLAVVTDGRALTLEHLHPALRAEAASDPWLLGLGELRVIGEALRRDPTGLAAALERIPRPPWPENLDLLDLVGLARRTSAGPGQQMDAPEDGTELMLLIARIMAARHPAPAARGPGWIEVTRWEGSADAAIFRADSEQLALLVRTPGRFIWVGCEARLEDRHGLPGVITTTTAFWFARLCEAGWLEESAALLDELAVRVRVELDRRPGPALIAAGAGKEARLIAGPGFVVALCRGDNDADRMLVSAGLRLTAHLPGAGGSELLDLVAPRGRGTYVIWHSPECEENPPRLPPPPPVLQRDRHQVETDLARAVVEPGHAAVLSGEQSRPAIEGLCEGLEQGIATISSTLGPDALLDLISLHERALLQDRGEAVGLPARAALADADAKIGARESIDNRNLVLRTLIERLAAAAPTDGKGLSLRDGGRLRAAGELQLKLLGATDALRIGRASGRVVVSPEYGIAVDLDGDLVDAGLALADQVAALEPDLMLGEHAAWWSEGPEDEEEVPALDQGIEIEDREWAVLDQTMAREWGVGFQALLRILRALHDLAEERPRCVRSATATVLVEALVGRTALDTATVESALERLTLGSAPDYRGDGDLHHPGRANRERSYLRRPLVALGSDGLVWSALHCLGAARYLTGLIESGRLRGPAPLRTAVTHVSQRLDRSFEDVVGERARGCGWQVKTRVRRMGGVALERRPGEEIGDIDILAWSRLEERIWLLDAKRLAPGIEPRSMVRERRRLERHADSHGERLAWAIDHRRQLASEIGDPESVSWQLDAALVLDRPLGGSHLAGLEMEVWTLWGISARLTGA